MYITSLAVGLRSKMVWFLLNVTRESLSIGVDVCSACSNVVVIHTMAYLATPALNAVNDLIA